MNEVTRIAHDTSITRVKKAHAFVSREEVDVLLKQLFAAGFTQAQICEMAGYTDSVLSPTSTPTKRLKMALIGVITSLGDKPHSVAGWKPSFDECALIFESANRLLAGTHPGPRQDTLKRLLANASQAMLQASK